MRRLTNRSVRYNDYGLFGRWCAEGVFFVAGQVPDVLRRVEVVREDMGDVLVFVTTCCT